MTISYGHGMAVTPLHLAAAYATLVNGGFRVQPSIIASDARPTEADRVISPRTSQQMREMLRQVVMRGTAKLADVPGYEVGGKTGTADKPNADRRLCARQGDLDLRRVLPGAAPKYVLVIALDEPTSDHQQDRVPHRRADRGAGARRTSIRRMAPVMGLRPDGTEDDDAPPLYTLAGNE